MLRLMGTTNARELLGDSQGLVGFEAGREVGPEAGREVGREAVGKGARLSRMVSISRPSS